jgi:hypothetical protein
MPPEDINSKGSPAASSPPIRPYFREVLPAEPDAASLVSGTDPRTCAAAIDDFLSRPLAIRERAALGPAERYSWDRGVAPLVAALAAVRA